jgi:hypothetical protein
VPQSQVSDVITLEAGLGLGFSLQRR